MNTPNHLSPEERVSFEQGMNFFASQTDTRLSTVSLEETIHIAQKLIYSPGLEDLLRPAPDWAVMFWSLSELDSDHRDLFLDMMLWSECADDFSNCYQLTEIRKMNRSTILN